MKSIKIRPLTLADDLNLKVNTRRDFKIEDPDKAKVILDKVMALASQFKGSGIIMAKSLSGQPAAVTTNLQTKDGHTFQFPEPNPVHLYFQNACNRLAASQILLTELKAIDPFHHEQQYNKFLEYFNEVTDGITFLVTSVEAFINQHIPDNIIYQVDENKQWNKSNIEWKDLKTKMKVIIPAIYGSHFLKTNEKEYSQILDVQDLRDALVHLKTEHKDNKTFYEDIIKRLLDFEPGKFVDAVFLYLNSIRPDYIQEKVTNIEHPLLTSNSNI